MLRISELVASVLIVVSLALTATSAAAQAPNRAPPPRAAPAPHPPAAAARAAPPPRMAAPPPRMAPPRAAPAPRMAVPPRAAPPQAAPHVAAPQRGPSRVAPPRRDIKSQSRRADPSALNRPRTPTRGPSASTQLSNQQRTLPGQERRAQRAQGLQRAQQRGLTPPQQRRLQTLQTQQVQQQQRTLQRQERTDRRAQQTQQRLEQRTQRRRLTDSQQRQLQSLQAQQGQRQQRAQMREQTRQGLTRQRQERADWRAQRTQQQLEQRAQHGRLTGSQQRQLQSLQAQQGQRQQRAQMREQMRQGLTQPRQQPGIEARQSRRAASHARVTPQAAAQNRFAGSFHHDSDDRDQWMRARREHWAARESWRHGIRAAFVPWYGAVYWPYAYSDIFDYTFWPHAYDDGYWASAYDDFFDGIFFPYGAPYVGDAYSGPYDTAGVVSSGSGARARTPQLGTQDTPIGSVSTASRELCEQPGNGVTAWPIEQIVDVVRPNDEQRAILDDLKNAGARAADAFRNACPTTVPMTPVGRLQAMIGRLQATLDAAHIVRPPLEKFYDSLSDEQKARFNAMGPEVGRQARTAQIAARGQTAADQQTNACVNAKPGLADLPIDRIDDVVQPTGDQEDALDRLSEATQKAVDTLQTACPTSTPLTPVGRLEAMEQRLNAMLTAAKAIQPALENFYASLNSEQKARFNELDRNLAEGG
jgi:hypothetical protein